MKKFVSVLLAMLIAAGLFVPAMAEGEAPLRVSISGNHTSTSNRIARGKTLALECSFTPPEGFEGEPSIEWFVGGKPAGTGRRLELVVDKTEGDMWNPKVNVSVKVTGTFTDENGEVLGTTGRSSVTVLVALKFVPNILQKALTVLMTPFAFAIPALFALEVLLMLPLALINWIWGGITSIFK